MAATYILSILLFAVVQSILPVATAVDAFLPASRQSLGTKVADTVRALDTNGNGKVDQLEIGEFAKSQGLSTEEVLKDFQDLDINRDGELDASEISGLLGDDAGRNEPHPPQGISMPAKVVAQNTQSSEASLKTDVAEAPSYSQQALKSMTFDLAALEHDAQKQAGKVMANRLAQRAQVLLARSVADERKAEQFDGEVRGLRGNATALSRNMNEETREVAREAVSDMALKSMKQLRKLQEQEHQAQSAADDHRAQAAKAMERVRKAQASLRAD